MPTPPKPVDPSHRIDPKHNGDNHAVQPPHHDGNGRPVDQKPNRDQHGRDIPPGHDHIGQFDRPDVRHNIHDVQDRWDHNNHGYDWHDWNGMRVAHHYDEFGFHNWGFYVGGTYFWTRYHDDNYWWYDPYWHRWCSLHEGQWWWQNGDGVIYVYTGNGYYQYGSSDSGVIMTPDPTPPVDVPPGDPTPAPANQISVYSLDGTRSIQVNGDNRDAYLYDLTVADPQSDAAKGRYIGTQVAGVNIIYGTQTADDGTETQVIQQIELSYDDSSSVSIVDLNGERRVDLSGEAQTAVLSNLSDSTVDPLFLDSGATGVTMNYQQTSDESGAGVRSLQSITLVLTDASGNQTTETFDPDGSSLDAPPSPAQAPAKSFQPTSAPAAVQTLQQKFNGSESFRALKSGFGW